MSKLFEITDIYGAAVTFNAPAINMCEADGENFMRIHFAGGHIDFCQSYDEFVQLWRKSLGEDAQADPALSLSPYETDMKEWLAYCERNARDFMVPMGFNRWRDQRA